MIEAKIDALIDRDFGTQRDLMVSYVEWLDDKPQDYWVYAAQHWIWDNGTVPFWWMIEDNRCDLAVASQIFWWGDPWRVAEQWQDKQRNDVFGHARLLAAIAERERTRPFVRSDLGVLETFNWPKLANEILEKASPSCPFRIVPPALIDGFGKRKPMLDTAKYPVPDTLLNGRYWDSFQYFDG